MDTIYPVNAVAGAPAYSGRMLRQAGAVLLGGATAVRPLGARSGVRPGTSTATVTATSTTWSCGPFAGAIDTQAAAEAGPYAFAFDAADGGALTAANASNPRVDIVYVQIDDPSESDGTSVPAVRRGYLAGVAAATPSAPAAPPRSFVVARINVPKSGGGTPTVSWVAPVAVSAGGILPLTGGYPASPYKGQYVDDPALGLLRFNGSTWGTSKLAWQYEKTAVNSMANNVYSKYTLDLLNIDTAGLGLSAGGFPVPLTGAYRVSGSIGWMANASGRRGGAIYLNGTLVSASKILLPATAAGAWVGALSTVVIAANAGDTISVQGFQDSGVALSTAGGAMTVELT